MAHQQKPGDSMRCTVSTPGPGPAESVGKPRKSLLAVDVITGSFFLFFFSSSPAKLVSSRCTSAEPHRGCLAGSSAPFPRHLLEACIRLLPSSGESWIAGASEFFPSFLCGSFSPFRAVANQTKRWEGAGGEKKKNRRKKRARERGYM